MQCGAPCRALWRSCSLRWRALLLAHRLKSPRPGQSAWARMPARHRPCLPPCLHSARAAQQRLGPWQHSFVRCLATQAHLPLLAQAIPAQRWAQPPACGASTCGRRLRATATQAHPSRSRHAVVLRSLACQSLQSSSAALLLRLRSSCCASGGGSLLRGQAATTRNQRCTCRGGGSAKTMTIPQTPNLKTMMQQPAPALAACHALTRG